MNAVTVDQVALATAKVEIRVVTVSGKQMTLSVFRQLKQESPLDSDGNWKGRPWGTVNYLTSGPPNVLWQKGAELRRGKIDHPGFIGHAIDAGDALDGSQRMTVYFQLGSHVRPTTETMDNWYRCFVEARESLPQLFIAI